jgi:outer membrane protein assembly factor BamB
MMERPRLRLLWCTAASLAACAGVVHGADWPTWRHDAKRSAASPQELPAELHLQWVRKRPPLKPAWPDQPLMRFDVAYEPVVLGDVLFVGSSHNDSVTAIDTETGMEKWGFYADGPVRFAPLAWKTAGRVLVYFVCDDGNLYCLDGQSGSLVWKYRGGPPGRRILGNGRLISTWPARGAPVLLDGTVYFAAGIWSIMGVFVHAVDAVTGKAVWRNDDGGFAYMQGYYYAGFHSIAPQGYLAASDDRLLVPNGRSVPACLSRSTGTIQYFLWPRDASASAGHGGFMVCAAKNMYFNGAGIRDMANGRSLRGRGSGPLLGQILVATDKVIYVKDGSKGHIVAYDIANTKTEPVESRIGRNVTRFNKFTVPPLKLWETAESFETAIRAGSRLYGIGLKRRDARAFVAAVDIPGKDARPTISWKAELDETPASVIAANDRLFLSTIEGGLYCFGEKKPDQVLRRSLKELPSLPTDEWQEKAAGILKATGVTEGYCVALGIGTGRLIEELAAQSKLHVVAIDPDAERVDSARRRLDKRGFYGPRVAVHAGEPSELGLPPYMASLIVVEDVTAAGLDKAQDFAETVFHLLRPYGGVACLRIDRARREALAAWSEHPRRTNAIVEQAGEFTLLKRVGSLSGSGDWTHQYGTAAKTLVSRDRIVKAPLGVLWFGGSSHEKILPRHGHGPSPQVVGGRLFIEGKDMIRAQDVYTGRILWEAELPGVGRLFNTTNHQPGASSLGSNYVSVEDGIYVVHGGKCLRLNPATGRKMSEFTLPREPGSGEAWGWGQVSVWQDLLIVAAEPMTFDWNTDFTVSDFTRLTTEEAPGNSGMEPFVKFLRELRDFQVVEKTGTETERAFVVKNLNRLLDDAHLARKIPDALKQRAKAETLESIQKQIDTLPGDMPGKSRAVSKLRDLNRRLLTAVCPELPKGSKYPFGLRAGANRNWDHTASKYLVVMDRKSGKVLWTRKAGQAFGHNGICVDKGRAFVIDRLPTYVLGMMERRGKMPETEARLLALDVRTGEVAWSRSDGVFGTWLAYSEEHDILIQSGRPQYRDMLSGEVNNRIIAYRGADGGVLWEKVFTRADRYTHPLLIHGSNIFNASRAYSLLTGERATRGHLLTGQTTDWSLGSPTSCGYQLASEHLITFRSETGGYYDLANRGGTGTLGGFKSGCSPNLIVADGVLSAPEYTRTCRCLYPNQCSLALIHDSEAEMWTHGTEKWRVRTGTIVRLGLNFGAPGDRATENGTMWVDYPSVGSMSPDPPVRFVPEEVKWYRHHSSRIRGPGLKWVVASGVKGLNTISVTLRQGAGEERDYIVRLHFAEPEDLKPGERVFSISLQGKEVAQRLDVVKEAGGSNRAVVKEFRGIGVKDDLTVTLTPLVGKSILSGIEITAAP